MIRTFVCFVGSVRKGGGYVVLLDGSTGDGGWTGAGLKLYVKTETEALEFPVGSKARLVLDTTPPRPVCDHTSWAWASDNEGKAVAVCMACGKMDGEIGKR